MSHSYLDFPDFDGAWRYSSTPSIATAVPKHIRFAGTPTLVHIRTPASRSLGFDLAEPTQSTTLSRRRAQSESVPRSLQPDASPVAAGAERPMSAILVSFGPVTWTSSADREPHPGSPANLPQGEENEAVSPKSRLPGPLQRAESKLMFLEPLALEGSKRIGTSLVAVKSPYPPRSPEVKGGVSGWVKRMVSKLRR